MLSRLLGLDPFWLWVVVVVVVMALVVWCGAYVEPPRQMAAGPPRSPQREEEA